MSNVYWNDWYAGWGWFLWFGIILLFFSSVGNWGYTYTAHRRFYDSGKTAIDILNERYARGDLKHDEYVKMKSHIQQPTQGTQTMGQPVRV